MRVGFIVNWIKGDISNLSPFIAMVKKTIRFRTSFSGLYIILKERFIRYFLNDVLAKMGEII